MKVPFMDLKRQYIQIKDEVDRAIQDTIETCAFVAGAKVKEFENSFAQYCGVEHAIGVSSGTSALYVALKALGIGAGDAVITIPNTFIATVEAIALTDARPILVDADENTYNIAPQKIREYIKRSCVVQNGNLVDKKHSVNIKAIMPVHLYGHMAEMDEIMDIAQQHNLSVVEDAAQAHGATYRGRKAGSIGTLSAFSFYPSKNLGAYGQGGMVTTNDTKLAENVRMLIDHGQKEKNQHAFKGWNFKMDGFQAAILNVKLKYLDDWNESRRRNASLYTSQLDGVRGIKLPVELKYCKHIYHLYVIRTKNRSQFQKYLNKKGISTSMHYPTPVHLQQAFHYLTYKAGDFPISELCSREVVSLAMFPDLKEEEIKYVCDAINAWASSNQ